MWSHEGRCGVMREGVEVWSHEGRCGGVES